MTRNARYYDYSSLYHVISRGNNKENIFFNDDDRRKFCQLLSNMSMESSFKIHLYCLMNNHFHLVLEIGNIPLYRIMQRLLSSYTLYINKKYERTGHLFQGRYKQFIIQSESYLLELCYYIHMNPIKAGIVDTIDQYYWSSHQIYIGHRDEEWLTTDLIRKILRMRIPNTKDSYNIFMSKYTKSDDEDLSCFLLGDTLESNTRIHDQINSREYLILHHLSIEKISEVICELLEINIDQLRSSSLNRKLIFGRSMLAYFAHYHGLHFLKDIGIYLNRHPDSLSRSMRHTFREIKLDATMKMQFSQLHRQLVGTDTTS